MKGKVLTTGEKNMPFWKCVMRLVPCKRLKMCKKLVDITEVLQHDVELSDNGIAVIRRILPFTLADYVVQSVVFTFEVDLKTESKGPNETIICKNGQTENYLNFARSRF
jgi:hypothetical protein